MWSLLLTISLLTQPVTASGLDTELANSDGVGAPSGPTAASTTALASVDFTKNEDRYEVVLGVPPEILVTATQAGDRVVVSLPGLTVPASLQRPLDTSFFSAPVTLIAAGATASGGQVTVTLRPESTWELAAGQDGYWRLVVRGSQHSQQGNTPPQPELPVPSYDSPMERSLDIITGESSGFTGESFGAGDQQ